LDVVKNVSDDEVRSMEMGGADARESDRIICGEMDNGVSTAVILDHGPQSAPILEAIVVYVDDVVFRRRATDSQVALVEIPNGVVSGAEIELEGVVIRATPKVVKAATAIELIFSAGDRAGGGWRIGFGVPIQELDAATSSEIIISASNVSPYEFSIAKE
jgi:hypothetical protein